MRWRSIILADAWQVIDASTRVMQRALRSVRTHNLSAANGLQLAAALTWSGESPEGHELVTLDQRLHEPAEREGFTVVPNGGTVGPWDRAPRGLGR